MVLVKYDEKYQLFSVRNKVNESPGEGYYCYNGVGQLFFLEKERVIAEFKYSITLKEAKTLYPEYFL